MDYEKLFRISNTILGDENKRNIFESYIQDFINQVNNHCIKEGWIDEYITIPNWMVDNKGQKYGYCIQIANQEVYCLKFASYDLEYMIKLFEQEKQDIENKTYEWAQFFHQNRPKLMEAAYEIWEGIKKFDFVEEYKVAMLQPKFLSLISKYKITYVHNGFFQATINIDLPLYKTITKEHIEKAVKIIHDNFKKEYIDKKLKTYYASYGRELSLDDKYLFVNYVYEQKDFKLAKELNLHRSKLPKHLKEKLDATLVLEKLSQAV